MSSCEQTLVPLCALTVPLQVLLHLHILPNRCEGLCVHCLSWDSQLPNNLLIHPLGGQGTGHTHNIIVTTNG